VTLEELAARVARLEEHQGLATKADLADLRLELSRDIANLAGGIGAVRQNLATLHNDLAEIRRLLERRAFRWPWEARS
jgi:hypothetical protein